MDEILVSATDYLLAIECLVFTGMVWKTENSWREVRRFFAAFFACTALASLAGAIYHGFFSTTASPMGAALWGTVLGALGLVAWAAWSIGACLLWADPLRSRLVHLALLEFLIYFIYVVAAHRQFGVAVANYTPSVIFLAWALARSYRRHHEPPVLAGLLGLALTGVAAMIQRTSWSLQALHLNNNSIYHLVQALGLFLIFRAALFLVKTPTLPGRRSYPLPKNAQW